MSLDLQQISWPGWETVRLIGRGSFGTVYEIRRDMLGEVERAALKVISIPQNESDIEELHSDGYDDESITNVFQNHLKSILAEYALMRKLNGCTNIVSCDDVRYIQHDDGIGWDIFIKMELLTPLTKALPADIPEGLVVKLAKDICTALMLCKKYNIVHRDIKPQNIFVSEYGDYKLGDFGIAKTVEQTTGGTKIGTYKYMAPEVFLYQPYGSAADIYSLGLVLYWLLNERRMPFLPLLPEKLKAGMEEEARERRFRGEQLPPPAHGSEKLKKIVLKACAYDPKDRYSTAEEMAKDLADAGDIPLDFHWTERPQPEKKMCTACGTQLLPGRRFCVKCGAPTDKTAARKVDGPDKNNAGQEKKHVLQKGQKQGGQERSQLTGQEDSQKKLPEKPAETKRSVKQAGQGNGCPHCGATLLAGRRFCIKCGQSIGAEHLNQQVAQGTLSAEQMVEERFRLLQQTRERRRKEQDVK